MDRTSGECLFSLDATLIGETVQTPTLYDTLFGDMPLADWAAHGHRLEVEPWPAFTEAAASASAGGIAATCRILRAVTQLPGIETRHILQAWSGLREFHCPEARNAEKEALGVVIEAAADDGSDGHDIMAVYADRTALYLDHSGAVTQWAHPDASLDEEIVAVLEAAAAILPQIGPWSGKRRPPPMKGNVRLNMLTPIGLCFGEGPFAAIARDPIAEPLVKAGAVLVQRLSRLPAATVN
jgi:hypothetical protein